jgi:hypothetical protein
MDVEVFAAIIRADRSVGSNEADAILPLPEAIGLI